MIVRCFSHFCLENFSGGGGQQLLKKTVNNNDDNNNNNNKHLYSTYTVVLCALHNIHTVVKKKKINKMKFT